MSDLIPNVCDVCYATIIVGKPLGGDHVAVDLMNLRLIEEVKAMGQGRRTFALHTETITGPSGEYQATWLTLRKPQDIKPGDATVLIEHEHSLPKMNNNTNKQIDEDKPPRTPAQIRQEVLEEAKALRAAERATKREVAKAFDVQPELVGIPAESQIIDALRRAGRALAAWEVARDAGVNVTRAAEQLKALSDAGIIVRLRPSGDGTPVTWSLPPGSDTVGAGSSIDSGN